MNGCFIHKGYINAESLRDGMFQWNIKLDYQMQIHSSIVSIVNWFPL